MIVIDNTIISDDLKNVRFVCNLGKCKGQCCVDGDAGAPARLDEGPGERGDASEVAEQVERRPLAREDGTGEAPDGREPSGTPASSALFPCAAWEPFTAADGDGRTTSTHQDGSPEYRLSRFEIVTVRSAAA